MWFNDEVSFPRVLRSSLWMLLIQEIYINGLIFLLKLLSWHPLSAFEDVLFLAFNWNSMMYHIIICVTAVAFVALHNNYYSVEKYICSTRFERICKSFNPYHLRHTFMLSTIGGLLTYSWLGLFNNFKTENISLIEKCFAVEDGLEFFFIVSHGFYTGMIFSLKYFIYNLYLVKFSLAQETKVRSVRCQILQIMKESVTDVVKIIHWHYVFFVLLAPCLKKFLLPAVGIRISLHGNILYKLLNINLFFTALVTGSILCFTWKLCICIFNTFLVERYQFVIEAPAKDKKNKVLCTALKCNDSHLMKYLAVLDLRFLAQNDAKRRQQFFTISQPGGHPHLWKSLTDFCLPALQDFQNKLSEVTMSMTSDHSTIAQKGIYSYGQRNLTFVEKKVPSPLEKVQTYFRERPLIAYFFDEIPNTKIMKLFASCQPLIWIIEALGFFISASHTEDKFGVVQRSLPEIICLLLDLKMAEEKLPMGMIGIRTHVKDPQGRYDHLHQRLSLKCAVNSSLNRIAATFKDYISGINLPGDYHRHFERYLNRKNT